jgi:hypothetical protein
MNRAALTFAAAPAETPAERHARRRFVTLSLLAAALIGAAAGILQSKGVI